MLDLPLAAPRHLRRLFAIGRIAVTHDLIRPALGTGLVPPLIAALLRPLTLFARPDMERKRLGRRLAAAATLLGPAFVKLGQTLATRADLVGEQVASDLAELQDRLPPFPAAAVRETLERELGQPIEALFAEFDPVPVAAASIAQVHFAELPPIGSEPGVLVAVKILRPGVDALLAGDLALCAWLADWAERLVPSLRRLKPLAVMQTIAEQVAVELDLRFEAAAATELARNMAGEAGFRVPAVDWTRTAKRVLTLHRVQGLRSDDRAGIIAAGIDPQVVLSNAANAFFKQVFRDGLFHADMHPGNLFVAPDGALVAVDFGIMGRLDWPTRLYLADMLRGFLTGDYEAVARAHFEAGYVPGDQSEALFAQAARAIGQPILGRPLAEISLARLLGQLFEVARLFQMETQPQLLLLQKTMLVAEGVGRSLDPTINMWELARPLVEDWVRRHRGPEARVAQTAGDVVEGVMEMARALPAIAKLASSDGIRLHPDTIAALMAGQAEQRRRGWGLQLLLAVLAGAVGALLAGWLFH